MSLFRPSPAIVDGPFVWLVGPVKTGGDAVRVGDIERAPWTLSRERAAADDFHDGLAQ